MKKLKILLVSDTYPPDKNGASIFTQRLAYGLASRGHIVSVTAHSINSKNYIETDKNVRVFRLKSFPIKPIHPSYRPISPFGLNKTMAKIVRSLQPDIIHLQNHFISGRAALRQAKKHNIPIVGTNHFMPENLLQYFPRFFKTIMKNVMWRDFLKVYNQLDYVTAPTETATQMLQRVGLRSKTIAISNGVLLKQFSKTTVPPNIYHQFQLDKNLPIFIFVGRLDKDKNVDLIIKAARRALAKTDFQIIIVGKGKDEKKLKRLVNKLRLDRKIIFTGYQTDRNLRFFLSLADVYIASGSAELQGIAVMEAMTAGLPILALNAIALPELVKNNYNGFLFSYDDKDLAEKMIKILKNKKQIKSMGKESLRLIQAHKIANTITSFENLYQKTIGRHKK